MQPIKSAQGIKRLYATINSAWTWSLQDKFNRRKPFSIFWVETNKQSSEHLVNVSLFKCSLSSYLALDKQLTLKQCGCWSTNTHAIKNPQITFDSPKTELSVSICGRLVPGTPVDIKIHGCSSPLYKMVWNAYVWPTASVDFQPWTE